MVPVIYGVSDEYILDWNGRRAPLYRKLQALLRGLHQWVQLELEVPMVSGTPLRFLHGHWRPGERQDRE